MLKNKIHNVSTDDTDIPNIAKLLRDVVESLPDNKMTEIVKAAEKMALKGKTSYTFKADQVDYEAVCYGFNRSTPFVKDLKKMGFALSASIGDEFFGWGLSYKITISW